MNLELRVGPAAAAVSAGVLSAVKRVLFGVGLTALLGLTVAAHQRRVDLEVEASFVQARAQAQALWQGVSSEAAAADAAMDTAAARRALVVGAAGWGQVEAASGLMLLALFTAAGMSRLRRGVARV